ncbi:MAG: Gamma-glutamyltranspeptidase @ Glutathione hydrolase [uncultured Gemmatimonadaceae bacterium]|uniref:Gamma-glutamyltranspeptidase @ Glutathione hydrolase n=1 Tax=uncultured Gemmatimonadaceae bacterium TaxID=246130 RepID=A0A6J4LD56_9BACT|nr:MAG: Gamma-glutamyltranspeptidase @ Glutathione hydrolase [uncultured Gemmatimonadaceae bacterium]
MLASVLLALAHVVQATRDTSGPAARPADAVADAPAASDPAYAGDGRLAVAMRGDLWVRAAGGAGRWVRVTSGSAWDREPAWTPDGSALVFASDRAGGSDLWRVRVGASGAAGAPERVTTSPEWDGEPRVVPAAVAAGARPIPAGTIIFVRGRGPTARLWLRAPNGAERRLTSGKGAERWPAPSPDGARIAYVATLDERPQLRVHWPAGDSGRTIVGDRAAERPVWSPGGDRIAFGTRAGRVGVWVAAADGRYVNLVSARRAAAAWSPDGRTLALAELPRAEPAYNGDPDRLGGREGADAAPGAGGLWLIAAPAPPDAGTAAVPLAGPADRRAWNAEAFDRVWSRTARLYYAGPDAARRRARWEALKGAYRPRALASRTDAELASVTHELLRARPPLREAATGRAAVSSAHPVATEAGLEILRRGGNVVDAAVAVSFALGVVEPDASGVGGYGQMLINLRPMREPALIEFMTRAPEAASLADAAPLRNGQPPSDGPALANVPGAVAGMYLAWQKYGSGKLRWADLLAPAIRAAERGVPVSEGLATTLATEREHFLKYEGSRALFFPRGEPLRAGDALRNPDLAWTLRQIADSGANAFYRGAVARRMVADLRGRGNAMRPADLARYFAAERAPVAGSYRGHTIYSSAPPVSGGATLVAQLNAIEAVRAPRLYTEDAPTLHAMIEAWKLVPGTRGRVADPGLWPVRTEAFLSKDSARARWRCFDPRRALTPNDIRGDTLPCARPPDERVRRPGATAAATEGAGADHAAAGAAPLDSHDCVGHDAGAGGRVCHMTGTTSFAVADGEGNVVSTTQTLGTWGGNFHVTPGLGFLYNDKLASYPSDPDEYGARLPNARHGSSLAPTIVFRGSAAARRPVLAAGAAGNAWITAAVYSIVAGVLDAGLGAQRALELPRFLVTRQQGDAGGEFVVQLESGFAPSVVSALEARGHRVQLISLPGEVRMGYAAAITIGRGEVTAGADPRRAGAAGAIGCAGRGDQGCRR